MRGINQMLTITTTVEISAEQALNAIGLSEHERKVLLPLMFQHELESLAWSYGRKNNDFPHNTLDAGVAFARLARKLYPDANWIHDCAPGGVYWNERVARSAEGAAR